MRLIRKAWWVGRRRGLRAVIDLAVPKALHILRIRTIRPYPYSHFEALSAIDPYQPATIPTPRLKWQRSPTMRLRWYMPEPGRGSGGHHTLFRLIRLLQHRGHLSEVAVLHGAHTSKSRDGTRQFVLRHFGTDVPVIWDTDDRSDVDIVLASSWQSAYAIATDVDCALRAYVVQDWEPDFYPRGSEQIMAENSYLLGYTHITAGPWLARRLSERGLHAEYFHLGADQETYHPSDEPHEPGRSHVVFYARPNTPRRCFEIGCEALRLLDRQLGRGRLSVSMVGAEIVPFPTRYRARWLGTVPPRELRRLYASADVVLVLSATNPSLVPLEAALCAAPVVDLRVPSAAGTFEAGVTGLLAPPSATSLAAAMSNLLADPRAAREMGRQARRYALQFTWEAAAATVERHLMEALEHHSRRPLASGTGRHDGDTG